MLSSIKKKKESVGIRGDKARLNAIHFDVSNLYKCSKDLNDVAFYIAKDIAVCYLGRAMDRGHIDDYILWWDRRYSFGGLQLFGKHFNDEDVVKFK